MNEATSVKKKNKKRRKGKGGKNSEIASDQEQCSQHPKQVTGNDFQVITTTKCSSCKGTFRQMIGEKDGTGSLLQPSTWICSSCVQELKSAEDKKGSLLRQLPPTSQFPKEVSDVSGAGGCNCSACLAKRENAISPEVERDAHITQTYWMDIRHVVRCIYRENLSLTDQSSKASIGSEKMCMIVKKLCSRDPHQFFQRLETLAREYLLEVKVRLLEQLSCGFNSPQLAIEFIQMLLEEYSVLCNSLPALLYLLKPLEECDYIHKLGMTVELMNKNIFRELIFAESFMSSNLPLIIAQLRLASLADNYHRTAADDLHQRYVALDHEMEEISQVWKSAKDHLNNKHLQSQQNHFTDIKQDGHSFKAKIKLQQDNSNLKSKPSTIDKKPKPVPEQNGVSHSYKFLLSDSEASSEQKWSHLLFKCIRPIDEPEFSIYDDTAVHTIALHLDLTQLDLTESKPSCTHSDLVKYHHLGLTVEEIVEVAMKLSSLEHLGLKLKIEDLFDGEGLSLSEINKDVIDSDSSTAEFFSDSFIDEMTLQRAKESVLQRHGISSHDTELEHDFLKGLTMKMRFIKKMPSHCIDHEVENYEKLFFDSCDQVQIKLTQLELNNMRLNTKSGSVGDDLGLDLDAHQTLNSSDEDHTFLYTDSHKVFMDLLLDKRRKLEELVTTKESQRRKIPEASHIEGLPRYQVKEQQESLTSKSNFGIDSEPIHKQPFKPLYYSKDSKPCQCSACVGAIAAVMTPVHSQSLNAADGLLESVAVECSLSSHLGLSSTSEESKRKGKYSNVFSADAVSNSSSLSKEGLWQNWMSTSGSAQLEHETRISSCHAHSHNQCQLSENCAMDSNTKNSEADVSSEHNCQSITRRCSNHQSSCIANVKGSNGNGSLTSESNSSTSSGETQRRYCPCCYCELFGHNGPPTAPTSQNYTKRRDIMRQKLEEKKKKREHHSFHPSKTKREGEEDRQTSVEELLAYIEGGNELESDQIAATKSAKKQKKRQKKLQDHTLSASFMNTKHLLFHHVQCDTVPNKEDMHPRVSGLQEEKSENESNYDDELEEFKKFCFADAPLGPRKKIAVSLNMHDIMSKLSN